VLLSCEKNEVLRYEPLSHETEGRPVGEFDTIDFFRGDELIVDPYPYFDYLRAKCPVQLEPHHDVVMVTGYEEAVSVFTNTATFSSCNAVTGPFPGFPVPLVGDDVSELIAQHRGELPFSDQITVMDPPDHKAHRGLLMRLITPKRLRENEDFMWRYADRQIDEFVEKGECEFIRDFAQAVHALRDRRAARRPRGRLRVVP
jgi:cytochrome P450